MFVFDNKSLVYFLSKLKEIFATEKELENKVDKVTGKDLSTNNFTNELLNSIDYGLDDVEFIQNNESTTISFYATSSEGIRRKIKDISLDI